MLKKLWKLDTTIFLSVEVTLVGPLSALFVQEENCIFLLFELIVKVLTPNNLLKQGGMFYA